MRRCRLTLRRLLLVFLVSHVTAYRAARCRAQHAVTACDMAADATNCRAFKASFSAGKLRRSGDGHKHHYSAKTDFHKSSFK